MNLKWYLRLLLFNYFLQFILFKFISEIIEKTLIHQLMPFLVSESKICGIFFGINNWQIHKSRIYWH